MTLVVFLAVGVLAFVAYVRSVGWTPQGDQQDKRTEKVLTRLEDVTGRLETAARQFEEQQTKGNSR